MFDKLLKKVENLFTFNFIGRRKLFTPDEKILLNKRIPNLVEATSVSPLFDLLLITCVVQLQFSAFPVHEFLSYSFFRYGTSAIYSV